MLYQQWLILKLKNSQRCTVRVQTWRQKSYQIHSCTHPLVVMAIVHFMAMVKCLPTYISRNMKRALFGTPVGLANGYMP